MLRRIVTLFWLLSCAVQAHAALDSVLVRQLAADDSDQKIAAIHALVRTAGTEAIPVLKALSQNTLYVAGQKMLIIEDGHAIDAVSGEQITPVPENPDAVTINNRVRGKLADVLALLKLFDPRRDTRLAATKDLEHDLDPAIAPVLERALAKESDPEIKSRLTLVLAQANLKNPDAAIRLAAVKALGNSGNPQMKARLKALLDKNIEPDDRVRLAARASLRTIETRLAIGDDIGQIFSGLSLGSVLLLAALGLAITYGVMGVINMAHGELLMVGAYATFVVQTLFRHHFPGALDWYVVAAVPVAFFSAALVGMFMERTVIRWLYGRPLETLLATWGISLILIQTARVIFGPQNVAVANPNWMSGGAHLMESVVLPWNRIIIIGFALFVLALVWVLLNRTRLGLFVRAVTQNRAMAGCVGVPTGRIDTLAFGLGAGIAGLGGVALSQIANVGPDMGQGYIVDSFMVVVLGGVGQLAGAVWAALGLGIASKFLEGWIGAVIAKIVVLAFIIIFIQKRPQGLFALKGRFVEN